MSDLYEIVRITNESEWKKKPDFNKINKYVNDKMHIRTIQPGGRISCQDTDGKCIYYVISGKYFNYRNSSEGKRNLVAIYNAPQWIGMDRALDVKNANITEDFVLEECVVIDIKVDYFIHCINEKGDIALHIIKNLLGKMSSASSRVDCMLFNDARTQILLWINEYWNSNYAGGDECMITLKNEYIAESIGISSRTLYRVLNELKKENIVTTKKGNIVISSLQIKKIKDHIVNKK